MNYYIIAIGSYLLGAITGYFLRGMIHFKSVGDKKGNEFVLGVVTTIWAISMLVDITTPTYTTSPLVHGLMGAIVGFFYKPSFTKTKK